MDEESKSQPNELVEPRDLEFELLYGLNVEDPITHLWIDMEKQLQRMAHKFILGYLALDKSDDDWTEKKEKLRIEFNHQSYLVIKNCIDEMIIGLRSWMHEQELFTEFELNLCSCDDAVPDYDGSKMN